MLRHNCIYFTLVTYVCMTFFISCKEKSIKNERAKVGVVAPLSGENAHYGEILKNGYDLAFSNDSTLSLVYEDSKFTKTGSISAINKLISVDKVNVVLGEVSSGNTIAIAPIAEKNKVILFASIASADTLEFFGDYVFRNIPGNKVQGITAANFLFNNLQIKTVAVFGANSEYGNNITTHFKNQYIKLGGQIVYDDSYMEGSKDFRTQLLKIKKSGAKALYIPGNENEPASILKQSKELNLNIPIIGGDGSATDNLIKIAGNSSEGFYCTNVLVDKTSQYYKNYRDRFYSKFNKEPGAYDAYAYEGAMIIIEAMRNSNNDVEKIKNYLYTHSFESMTGTLKFDKMGEVDRLWGMYQVVNGQYVETR